MREKTHYAVRPDEIEIRHGNAGEQVICFRQNIQQSETDGRTEYIADEYLLTVRASDTLAERVNANPQKWMKLAISKDRERTAKAIRTERDRRLAETDYLLTPDYPITGERLQALKAYRQALREIPEQEGFPYEVDFPMLEPESKK